MRVQYPSHLYIRCDRELRNALLAGAQAAGETVSVFARRHLRAALSDPDPSAGETRAHDARRGGISCRSNLEVAITAGGK